MRHEHGVDRVRAAATLCVVAIHCQPPFYAADSDVLGRVIAALMEWAVPAFFLIAGYVRSRTTRYPAGTMRRWLTRLLPVYVLASVLALLCRRFVLGEAVPLVTAVLAFLTGSAWSVYYFVPVFVGALLFSHVLARWPGSVPWITAVSLVSLVATRADPELDPLWREAGFEGILRSPFYWWGYFFVGWSLKQWLGIAAERERLFLVSSVAALLFVLAFTAELSALQTAVARVGASIAIPVSVLSLSARPLVAATALISEYSYDIYLFHIFSVAVVRHWGFWGNHLSVSVALWVIALATGVIGGMASRRVLGSVGASALR